MARVDNRLWSVIARLHALEPNQLRDQMLGAVWSHIHAFDSGLPQDSELDGSIELAHANLLAHRLSQWRDGFFDTTCCEQEAGTPGNAL